MADEKDPVLEAVEKLDASHKKTAKEASEKMETIQKNYDALLEASKTDAGAATEAKKLAEDALKFVKDFLAEQGRKGAEGADKVIKTFGGLIHDQVDLIEKSLFDNLQVSAKGQLTQKMEMKAVQDMTLATNLTGNYQATYLSGIVGVPFWPIHVRDLVGVTPSGTDSFHYFRHIIGEGAIDWQSAEGATKPQIDEDFAEVIEPLKYLAGWLNVTRQMLRNIPALQSYLSQWLPERYYQAEDLKAIAYLVAASGKTTPQAPVTGDNLVNRIILTIAAVETNNAGTVNGIAVSPLVWAQLLTNSGTQGIYTLPGSVTVGTDGGLRINGIPVFKALWLPANTAIIADWRYFTILQSEGLSLQFSYENQDNFVKNKVTVRIEASIGFALYRPAAFSFMSTAAAA